MQFTSGGETILTDHLHEITNSCTCTKMDPETFESTDEPADYCYGDCWEFAVEQFGEDTKELREISDTWVVEGLPLWNRSVSGSFTIKNVADLIRGITVNSDWRLRYKVTPTHIWCYLSHHDATGSFKAYPVLEDGEE